MDSLREQMVAMIHKSYDERKADCQGSELGCRNCNRAGKDCVLFYWYDPKYRVASNQIFESCDNYIEKVEG